MCPWLKQLPLLGARAARARRALRTLPAAHASASTGAHLASPRRRVSRPAAAQRNAVAVFLWHDRIIAFLDHISEAQMAKCGDLDGMTREYLRFMLKELATADAFAVYMPVCAKVAHVDHVLEMKGISQGVYEMLCEIGQRPERW